LSQEIAGRATARPLDLSGKLDILQLGAVLEQCSAVVSGDTGPMHVATAVGTPVIGLFGPTDPARTGPIGRGHTVLQAPGVDCVPCRDRTCRNPRYLECMDGITPEAVASAVAAKLNADRRNTSRA
jgi:ADP-heptose:LPS heptosyltransferase